MPSSSSPMQSKKGSWPSLSTPWWTIVGPMLFRWLHSYSSVPLFKIQNVVHYAEGIINISLSGFIGTDSKSSSWITLQSQFRVWATPLLGLKTMHKKLCPSLLSVWYVAVLIHYKFVYHAHFVRHVPVSINALRVFCVLPWWRRKYSVETLAKQNKPKQQQPWADYIMNLQWIFVYVLVHMHSIVLYFVTFSKGTLNSLHNVRVLKTLVGPWPQEIIQNGL